MADFILVKAVGAGADAKLRQKDYIWDAKYNSWFKWIHPADIELERMVTGFELVKIDLNAKESQ